MLFSLKPQEYHKKSKTGGNITPFHIETNKASEVTSNKVGPSPYKAAPRGLRPDPR
jgi:hypothetical protein